MDHIEHINPAGVAAPRSTYSHAVVARGRTLWLAGQVPVDEDGAVVGAGDPGAQVRAAMRNVARILDAAGAGWGDVVRFTIYVVGADNVPAVRSARAELWAEYYPGGDYPAGTFLVVDRLASEDFLVEIEATAVLA